MNDLPIHVVAAVIRHGEKVLISSRPEDKPPAGWEFPGGKVEPGETLSAALERELSEELALNIIAADEIFRVKTDKIVLHFIRAAIKDNSTPAAQENQSWKWVTMTPDPPEGILKNDLKLWKFITNSL